MTSLNFVNYTLGNGNIHLHVVQITGTYEGRFLLDIWILHNFLRVS